MYKAMVAIVAFIVVIAIAVAAYQFDWWLKAENTDRQVEIDNNNQGTQTAWADQVRANIRDFELLDPSNTAQRGALARDACELIPRLVDSYRTDDIVAFELENC